MQQPKQILKDFGDHLVMRCAGVEDAARLADFNARIHGTDPHDAAAVAAWTRDLLEKDHPTFHKEDYLLVENTATGEIVSSMNSISQTWVYEGIPFPVGRPELVGTDPAYRNRGLVRAQFEALHESSTWRGELVQVITGIPFYYRQFGYEMALNLSGGRIGFEPHVPALEEGAEEPFVFRQAAQSDIPFILCMMELEQKRSMVCAQWNETLLLHEMLEKSTQNVNRQELRIIEDREGTAVGYIMHPGFTWWGRTVMLVATAFQLVEGASYYAVTPSLIRYLWMTGQEYAQQRERKATGFGFWFGSEHPAYQAAASRLPHVSKPYAFYMRVPDLPAFLCVISPALERRLEQSIMVGYSGELNISFYRGGVRMVFEKGKMTTCERWDPPVGYEAACFPGLTFLQLVFGYRRLEEIRSAFADCMAGEEQALLLDTLFPKKHSDIMPIS